MDSAAAKQKQINQKRKEVVARYPALWAKMIAEWSSPSREDRVWLLYSANYLFRTGDVRWAIDPMTLQNRVPEAAAMDVARDLSRLSFVLLTHRHQDHMDMGLLRALGQLPIQWVIPEFLLTQVLSQVEIPVQRILVPRPSCPIELFGIRILPFDGLHLEGTVDAITGEVSGSPHGVPAIGYWIKFGGKRWLFPGDTRMYAADRLPQFGPVEGVFAHLWLGRGGGLLADPPLLSEFCRFCVALQPARVVITHMEEFGRRAGDYWDIEHFCKVSTHLHQISPDLLVAPAFMGESVCL